MRSNTAAGITAGLSAPGSGANYLTSKRVCVFGMCLTAAKQELCRISGDQLSSSRQAAGIMWAGFNQHTVSRTPEEPSSTSRFHLTPHK